MTDAPRAADAESRPKTSLKALAPLGYGLIMEVKQEEHAGEAAASVDDLDPQRPAVRNRIREPLLEEGDAFLAGGEWRFHGSS